MKNKIRKYILLTVILALSILVSYTQIIPITVLAENKNIDKIYCNATLESEFTDNEIIISVFSEYNRTEYNIDDFSTINCISIKELWGDVPEGELGRILMLTLEKHSKQNVLDAIDILEERRDIYCAEPNYIMTADASPNDTQYTSENQWAIDTLELPYAWSLNTGNSSIKVGVIDSGIDGTHPDLVNRIDTDLSYCFSPDYTNALEDETGHGTHVAGIIGAQGNNSIGITGICWNIQLVSLRVANMSGNFNASSVVEAIKYANDQSIPILNYSGGTYENSSTMQNMALAIRSYFGLFVCAAGNAGTDNDTTPYYPSDHNNLPNLISVGASNPDDSRRASSNYGANKVDLFAPGTNILSCFPIQRCIEGTCHIGTASIHFSNGYHFNSGTSMAAPHVAGTAALLLSRHPDLSASNMKQIILNSVDTLISFEGLCKTGGRLNSYEAIVYRNFHNHTYTYENCGDNHKCTCTVCNYTTYEAHDWEYTPINPSSVSPQYIPQYTCTKCGAISLTDPTSTLSTEEHLHIAWE